MPFDPTAARSGAVFSDVPNYQVAWICYINGIEVPIIGFQTECQIWQVPSFTIHCIPDPLIQRLGTEDRVPVQIFYLDSWASDRPTFRLLIDGEIVGWNFSSSTGSRTIAFSCLAHIQIFQQLYFFYMTNVDDIVASQSPEVRAQGFAVPGLLYPYAIFHQGLLSTSSQQDDVSPVYDEQGNATAPSTTVSTTQDDAAQDGTASILCAYEMVTNVIKGVISSKVPLDRRAVPMMNFFARYIRKTRFHNRWVRLPLLEDAAALNERKGVFPIFNAAKNDQALIAMQRQVVSQVGSSGPVWNLFQQVLGLVYMEIAMIPNPACVQVKLAPLAPNQPEEGKILRPLYDSEPLTTYRRGLIATGDAATDPLVRRAEANVDAAARLSPTAAPPASPAATPPYDTSVEYTPPPVGSGVRLPQNQLAEREAEQAEERRQQQRTENVNAEHNRLVAAQTQALAAQGARDLSVVGPVEPIRLAQHFVKPNFFFGEVPSCNVIMPSMIDSWTYDESYINQPTRVYVNDSVMTRALRATGSNREFMLHALTVGWPEEANALMRHRAGAEDGASAGGGASGAESGRNLLIWPEEFYKGPVTARSELPAWFQMLQQFSNSGESSSTDFYVPPAPGSDVRAPSATPRDPHETELYVPPAPGVGVRRLDAQGSPNNPFTEAPTQQAGQGAPLAGAGGRAVLLPATPSSTQGTTGTADPAASGTAQNAIQTATQQARADTAPAPVRIPGSTQYATTSNNTARTAVTPGVSSLPAFAMPVQIRPGLNKLSLNGSRAPRFWLARGSGLDPDKFIPPKTTAPWPLPTPSVNGNRRGRSAPTGGGGYTTNQKLAMVVQLLTPACRAEFPGLNEAQLLAVAFACTWVTFTENGVRAYFSWALGNAKQYALHPNLPWTINPYDRQPYQAAATMEEGARYFVADLKRRYSNSLNVLLSGVTPPELTAFLREQNKLENPFWAANAPIRPDLFYIHLGYIGYYETENQPDRLVRAQTGISRTGSQARYFTAIKRLIETNAVPAPTPTSRDIPVAYQRPLFQSTDAPLITNSRARIAGGSTGGSGAGGATSDPAEAAEGDAFSKLFEIYAENEYLKQRYAQRNAGANLRFNPYLVVGFPSMLFDSMRTRMHCVGYLQAVSHSAMVNSGGSSMSTTVRMSFCRTLQEFINDVRTDATRFNGRITSAPAEIIEEIRVVIQDDTNAEAFYQKLFYGGAPPTGSPACFRWEQAMGYANGIAGEEIYIEGETNSSLVPEQQAAREQRRAQADGETDAPQPETEAPSTTTAPLDVFTTPENRDANARLAAGQGQPLPGTGGLVTVVSRTPAAPATVATPPASQGERNAQAATQAPATATTQQQTATGPRVDGANNLDPNRELSPRLNTAYADAFDNYHIAMQLAARPVCTLEQYIRFWHGGRTINDLLGANEIAEPRTDFSYASVRVNDITRRNADGTNVRRNTGRPAAQYYGRIFKLRTGPGDPPEEGERGYTSGPNIQPSATNVGVDAAYPETRANWDSILLEYRNRIRQLLSPST